jgi:hypothetical protein
MIAFSHTSEIRVKLAHKIRVMTSQRVEAARLARKAVMPFQA